MKDIRIIQPYKAELPYTIYSIGKKAHRPAYSGDDRSYIYFTYPPESVFCLFYEWRSRPRNLRRAYIVTGQRERTCGGITLPGASSDLEYLYVARGRAVDNLMRGTKYLAEISEGYFSYPELFWYRFAALVEYEGKEKRRSTLTKNDIQNFLESWRKWEEDS